MTAFVAAVLARRRTVQGLFALLVVAMLPGLARLETDNSAAVFFLAGSGEVARYDAFVERFGSDAGLRIVVSGGGALLRPRGSPSSPASRTSRRGSTACAT